MARHSCPRTLSSFMHRHILTLFDYTGYHNTRLCNICNKRVDGLVYQCRSCGFDVHPLCTLLPRHLKHALHLRHQLVLRPSANRPCAVCQRVCTRWRYSCSNGCSFDIHPGCVLKRSVNTSTTSRRPQLRRVQQPPVAAGRRVVSTGPHNNNHFNHFTHNLHYQHANHLPQYYMQNNSGAVVQRPFNNLGYYYPAQGGTHTGHRSVGRKMYEIVETLALGVLSSVIFGMFGFDFSAFM